MILGVLISLLISLILIGVKLKTKNVADLNQLTFVKLPPPIIKSNISIEEALKKRRSSRRYKHDLITLKQVAQLLWAAQGITAQHGFRTAPSAGALYPLRVYLVTGNIKGLPAGVYHYSPENHGLELQLVGDKRTELAYTSQHQRAMLNDAKMHLVITASYEKTMAKYGPRGKRYVDMEAGHVAENISLQAVSLGVGTVTIGAFEDERVKSVLHLREGEAPLYIMPVGKI